LKREQDAGGGGIAAWAVHLLTASGAVLALLALDAVEQGREFAALAWLGVALIVDGVDGTLARAANVRERAPNIDGNTLDLVVDYLTYVFVPALLIWRGGYFPGTLALPLTAAILLSSLYVFARRDMKTDDGYFRGFPALWNIVAFYLVVATPSPGIAAAIVVILVAMTFAHVHVVHPFRVRDYGTTLPMVAIGWAALTAPLLIQNLGIFAKTFLLIMSLATAAVMAMMGLLRTARGPRAQ
jgi:phosphatidylcholine synthase